MKSISESSDVDRGDITLSAVSRYIVLQMSQQHSGEQPKVVELKTLHRQMFLRMADEMWGT